MADKGYGLATAGILYRSEETAVANKIDTLRFKKGMSERDFCILAGFNRSAWQKTLKGETPLRLAHILAAMVTLEVELSEILDI